MTTELQRIDYNDSGTALVGLLARPSSKPRGAIVVFPTIVNTNPHTEQRARMLADAGFVAMIADFYGEPIDSTETAFALSGKLRADVDRYRARVGSAVTALRNHDAAAGLVLGAIGYCMGGQAALEAVRAGEDLAMVASFHGLLDTGRRATVATPIKPRILVCHGDADPMVPRSSVTAFWEEMDAAGAQWHFHSYSGVKHGFTDPEADSRGMPALGYNVSADRQSWSSFMSFADEVFG